MPGKFSNQVFTRRIWLDLILLPLFLYLLAGCNNDAKKEADRELPGQIELREYYPFHENSYWAFDWEDNRGDRWHGSITVTRMAGEDEGYNVFLITDTTIIQGDVRISKSAYMWDDDGLKHLYRVAENGDSTCFRPPRIALPSRIEFGKPYEHDYHYEVFTNNRETTFSGDARQKYKLQEVGSITTAMGKWKDAIAIESVRVDEYTQAQTRTKRQLVWYVRGVGPVKIIIGIPPDAKELTGDTCGQLVNVQ